LQGRFQHGIGTVPEDRPVPHCEGWTVRDLVEHLAEVHHWAAAMARNRDETPLHAHPSDLAGRYAECAAELRATLASLPPDAPARTLDGPGRVSFWHRRQVHETLVHLHDLLGRVDDVPTEVWTDAVDEVVTVLLPRQMRLGRSPAPTEAVRLIATDAGSRWLLGTGPAAAEIRGTGQELTLLIWGRMDLEGASVTGDVGVGATNSRLGADAVRMFTCDSLRFHC
jgi:uncharacterized protein (TIGR03083 family)